jgi:GNAT superfamily N-acetyltransferase
MSPSPVPSSSPSPANSRLRVRPATEADLPTILDLIRALAEYEREPDAVEATEDLLRTHLFGRGFGRGPTAECLMGEIDGRVEGFAVFCTNFSTWLGRPGIWLEDLFVRPSSRGAGLGKALLVELARLAVERGCGRMEWTVLDWNEPSLTFYRHLGAKPLDEWTSQRLTGAALVALAKTPRT